MRILCSRSHGVSLDFCSCEVGFPVEPVFWCHRCQRRDQINVADDVGQNAKHRVDDDREVAETPIRRPIGSLGWMP